MRLSRSAAAVLAVFMAGCGADHSTSATPGAPSHLDVAASPSAVVNVAAAAGSFAVRVTDAAGAAVPNVAVTFTVIGMASVSPAAATTDANGIASTVVTAGTQSGVISVRATVAGIATGVTASVTIVPGAAAKVANSPNAIRLSAVGDTARILTSVQDQFGNTLSATVSYVALDPTLVGVDATGLVRALRLGNSSTLVIASSGVKSDTTVVTVAAPAASSCAGFATPATLQPGQSVIVTSAQYVCIGALPAAAEYAVVSFNASVDPQNAVNVSVTPAGIGSVASASSVAALTSARSAPAPNDDRFHLQLLDRARSTFANTFGRVRTDRASRAAALREASLTASGAIPATAAVGDILTLNVSANFCDLPIYHGLRVAAVGTRSVVLADTLNPPGFATADYQKFAANFDTLVYALDVGAFGAPVDLDNNGKVGIIFTRTVNELVNANTGYFVGGFFNYRDIYPRARATASGFDCPGSNEGEMFYLVVPATDGINGVIHTVGQIDTIATGIIAHEFQHLINAEHRLYLSTTATNFEQSFVNEGLSHIAEELLYFRQSGNPSRADLDDAAIRANGRYPFFQMDALPNFRRLATYLPAPGAGSPYANNDDLSTRGASWSFLRYAADRLYATDSDVWQRMVNSGTSGLATIQVALDTDPLPLYRDWAVSLYTDNLATVSNTAFQQRSWNYRDIFGKSVSGNASLYPLAVTSLVNGVKADFAVRGGSAGYARFVTVAGGDALLSLTSGGGLPPATMQFVIVRTR